MIPKFSIRQLLWTMVAIGLLSLCMSSAARGNRVAFGISVALIGSIIPLTVYAVVHWASFGIANLTRLVGNRPVAKTLDQPVMAAGIAVDSVDAGESENEVGETAGAADGDQHV